MIRRGDRKELEVEKGEQWKTKKKSSGTVVELVSSVVWLYSQFHRVQRREEKEAGNALTSCKWSWCSSSNSSSSTIPWFESP